MIDDSKIRWLSILATALYTLAIYCLIFGLEIPSITVLREEGVSLSESVVLVAVSTFILCTILLYNYQVGKVLSSGI